MWVENPQLQTEVIISKEQVDTTKLDIDRVKSQIETQLSAKTLKDEILNDADRKLTHEQIVSALSQYENQSWPDVIDKNSAAYVISLQLALKALWYEPGKIDALYGSTTKSAVEAFQTAQWLSPDGWAGPYTMEKLIAALGWIPKPLTPDTRPVATQSASTEQDWSNPPSTAWAETAPKAVTEKPKDLVEALTKQPLTAFDKKWLKENLGVEDITKIPAWKEWCNGVAYYIEDNGMQISMQKNGKTEGKWWWRDNDWTKYVWEWKNDKREGKWTYMYENWDKYVWEWVNDHREGKWTYYYYADGSIGRDGTYKNDEYIDWTATMIEKTPEKTFPLEQLNDIQMKTIWENYIAPEFSSKRQKEWLAKKWIKSTTLTVHQSWWLIQIMSGAINVFSVNTKNVAPDNILNLPKFVTAAKKSLWDTMAKDYQKDVNSFDKKLLNQYLEGKTFLVNSIFTDADRADPIRKKQIDTLMSNYFFDETKIWIENTETVTKNGKKYIKFDLDSGWLWHGRLWDIQIPYEMAFDNWKFKPWTFQKTLRKYIIDELFSKKDKTDLFTKIRDQNIKLDL